MKSNMTASTPPIKSPDQDIDNFRKIILNWYDKNQRVMPWRAIKGQTPNPYHVWLSEIMLQQTTVATVGSYFTKFISIWPTIEDLAKAERDNVMKEWAGLGYYARARNLHKCAQIIVKNYEGKFPSDEVTLKTLPGIGDYTSASVLSIAFGKEANVVDGNIERIMARLYSVEEPLPLSKKILKKHAGVLTFNKSDRPGDYAQALMDIGATICTPKSPKCGICPVQIYCHGYQKGIQAELPKKLKKSVKPQKSGEVFWVSNNKGDVLFEKRGEKVMLGGMIGLPTSEWKIDKFSKNMTNYEVYHSFTHFDLKLKIVKKHEKELKKSEKDLFWVRKSEIEQLGLPTLFKKVTNLMKSLDFEMKENL